MSIDRPYVTFYLFAIAMFALSVTICEKFAIEMCIPWPLEWVKYKYAKGKAICNFLFGDNSNICTICHSLWDINSWNVHDLAPELYNWSRSNVDIPIERPHATFCVDNSYVCPICHHLKDNNVWTSQYIRCKSLIFKKVKDVDDLDENWQAKVSCQCA